MITTHVLDTSSGKPGRGIAVELERAEHGVWHLIGAGITDDDGRLRTLTAEGDLPEGTYRIRFQVASYFTARQLDAFYPIVEIQFSVLDGTQHYHVPLLLSPFGFSTYRGS